MLFASCENSASVEEEEHSDPFGVALILNGVEIAKQENGVVSYAEGDHLELKVGEETNLITVRWIAEDGDRFVPDEAEGYGLQWVIDNEAVTEVEQHEEDGAWSFHLVGTGTGETEIRFELFHNDHSDFTSLPFEVHVEEAVSGMELRDDTGSAVVTVDSEGNVTGSIDVASGSQAGPFTLVFFDDQGGELDTSSEYELEWHTTGTEFATITADTNNPFSIMVDGVTAGQAEVHFELIKGHSEDGGDDHDHDHETVVYESPDIAVNVN
ncbi:hypothetical protein DDZ15_05295 [Rhodohalobacter mucosus]|uniref:Uncharacterized protein n=1 Tax=Rhodohalobacter mucosus TaxID=2079485 RepID=A0A316TVP5_9BACT|nr:hypothetical protein DDZ15_05295 [Rhodohalobacter mucosus]